MPQNLFSSNGQELSIGVCLTPYFLRKILYCFEVFPIQSYIAFIHNSHPWLFEAGLIIIEKDKASIGMMQREFKLGFNRAARIMDQLCELGVVGDEEGTKSRKVLMTTNQFCNAIEEII